MGLISVPSNEIVLLGLFAFAVGSFLLSRTSYSHLFSCD